MAVRGPLALALLLGAGLAGPAHADRWTNLWLRPDQQGDRAIGAGHAEEAARLYEDPLRRGYAELEAGQFAAAARDLEPYREPLALYDRGNALAHQGQLKPALDAYDAALARAVANSPLARNARHNRDLVARALAQQAPQNGSGGAQGNAGQSSPRPRPEDEARNASGQKAQNFSGMNQSAEQDAAAGQNGLGQANASPGNATPAESQPGNGSSSGERPGGRDATAQGAARRSPGEGDPGPRETATQAGAPDAAASEQAIAREQWLRQIPDDPAGLLRRKFMIEHLLQQQEGRP